MGLNNFGDLQEKGCSQSQSSSGTTQVTIFEQFVWVKTEPVTDELQMILPGSFGKLNIMATTHYSGPDHLFLVLKPKSSKASHPDLHSCLYTCALKADRNSLDYCIITLDNQDYCSGTTCFGYLLSMSLYHLKSRCFQGYPQKLTDSFQCPKRSMRQVLTFLSYPSLTEYL